MTNTPVIIEDIFDSPVAQVWQAITGKDKMKQWYFDLDKFEPRVGFEFMFPGKGHKGESYIHICKVKEVVPYQRLQYSWQYENHAGYSLVTFELFEEGDKTWLKLTHEGLETFPKGNPDFAKESFIGGWTALVTQLLKSYLQAQQYELHLQTI